MNDWMAGRADPFTDRLLRGEKVVWRGRPQQGLMLTARDGFLIPFSLLWGGFAIFWESSVLRAPNPPVVMVLFGIPFVLIGLFLIVGRFLFDAWVRTGVFYALTDRRILIVRSRPSASFQSVSLDRLPEATLNETSNGRGTIRFGATGSLWSNRGGFGSWIAALDPIPQFLAIDDARKVFASIQERAQIVAS
jgi:hypothetical protein